MVFIPVLCGDIHSRSLSWYSFLYSVVIFIHMLFDIFIPMLSGDILTGTLLVIFISVLCGGIRTRTLLW